MAPKSKKYNPKGPYGGKGEADMAKKMKEYQKLQESRKYSPRPMSPSAKSQTAMRAAAVSLAASKTKPARKPKAGSSTVSKVVKRAKTVAREAGDVKKAVKNVAVSAKSALNLDRTGNQYLGRQAVKATGKDLGKQLKELGSAVKSGKPGKRAGNIRYNDDTGTPAGLIGKQRPKYGAFPGKSYKTGQKKK